MPLNAAIGRVFALYCPDGCHGHRFWRKKLVVALWKSLFEAAKTAFIAVGGPPKYTN
jgi:hypothetical protein